MIDELSRLSAIIQQSKGNWRDIHTATYEALVDSLLRKGVRYCDNCDGALTVSVKPVSWSRGALHGRLHFRSCGTDSVS